MKLRGTITEQAYRKELQTSRIRILNDISMRMFLKIIRETFPEMKTAYILYWTPDEGKTLLLF